MIATASHNHTLAAMSTESATPRMPLSSSVAVDVVLRAHATVTALPNVVRSIRQFAQAPLFERLTCVLASSGSSADTIDASIERILATHNEDLRLEALECRHEHEPVKLLPSEHNEIVTKAILCAAERGSLRSSSGLLACRNATASIRRCWSPFATTDWGSFSSCIPN